MKRPEVGPVDAIVLKNGRCLSIDKASMGLGFVSGVGAAEDD